MSGYYPKQIGQITFNSNDGDGPLNDFSIAITLPSWKIDRILFNEMTLTQSWYVFSDGSYNGYQNNLINFHELGTGGVLQAAIPPGNYSTIPNTSLGTGNYITIQDQVTASMNAAGGFGTYSCSYNYNTSLLTISSTVSFSILWSLPNDCSKQLGFKNIDTGYALSQKSYSPIQITNSGCIYIYIQGMALNNLVLTSIKNPTSGTYAFCVQSDSNGLFSRQNTGNTYNFSMAQTVIP